MFSPISENMMEAELGTKFQSTALTLSIIRVTNGSLSSWGVSCLKAALLNLARRPNMNPDLQGKGMYTLCRT